MCMKEMLGVLWGIVTREVPRDKYERQSKGEYAAAVGLLALIAASTLCGLGATIFIECSNH